MAMLALDTPDEALVGGTSCRRRPRTSTRAGTKEAGGAAAAGMQGRGQLDQPRVEGAQGFEAGGELRCAAGVVETERGADALGDGGAMGKGLAGQQFGEPR